MRFIAAALTLLVGVTAAAIPCTNGSFEEVAPNGVPVDWQPMGNVTVIDTDAHSGARCVRIVRTGDEDFVETGMNRHWDPSRPERGAMIEHVKGGMEFWYKVPDADANKLSVYVIPMNASPAEETSSQRTEFVVPDGHKGDGEWHRARVKYDYSDNPNVKWVHFAPRLLQPGEILFDDFAWLEHVGPMLTIERVRLEESGEAPGQRAVLHATVTNSGDQPVRGASVELTAKPAGLQEALDGTASQLGDMAPGFYREVRWPIDAPRTGTGELRIKAAWVTDAPLPEKDSPDYPETEYRIPIAPALSLINWGPVEPVAAAGEPIAIEAFIENTGNALLPAPVTMTYTLGGFMTNATLDEALPPGRKAVVRGTSIYVQQSPAVSVVLNGIRAGDYSVEGGRTSSLVVGANTFVPLEELASEVPDGRALARETADYVACVNRDHALVFRRNDFGYGPGEILARTEEGWRTWLWMPRLSTIVFTDSEGSRTDTVPLADTARVVNQRKLHFSCTIREGVEFACLMHMANGEGLNLRAEWVLSGAPRNGLLRFDGPMFYMPDRTEAIVPGLEWLVDDEVSSSALDIQAGHPHQVRYTPDPHMFTMPAMGLTNRLGSLVFRWDRRGLPREGARFARVKVAGTQPVFASPDRFGNQRSHLFGIQLPTAPDYLEPNTREAARPFPVESGQLKMAWRLDEAHGTGNLAEAITKPFVRGTKDGYTQVSPTPLPHGSYDAEIQFGMNAYFDSLYLEDENRWLSTKNGPSLLSYPTRDPNYVADILIGALHSPDADVRARCRAMVEEHAGLLNLRPTIETLRLGVRPDRAVTLVDSVAGTLAARDDDGLWHFDADRKDTGVFRGMNYHELGEDGAVAVGNNADKARSVLRYARVAGDWQAYEAMVPVLEFIQSQRVPRAAQVWEVPFHTPDILAASDAVECFMEAYWFSGEARWLEAAREWAFKGLPFIYVWQQKDKPYTRGASIPVFGATWFVASWFGRPVQWNGLRYADALLMLDEEDDTYDWRTLAETIINSVFYQMEEEGEDIALWPDSISVIDGEKSAWVFGPRMPIASIMKLRGQSEVARTTIVGEGRNRIHISALAEVNDADWDGERLHFKTAFPEGYAGFVVLSNVTRPGAVALNGAPLAEIEDLFRQDRPGWYYDEAQGFLSLQLGVGDGLKVSVEGARFRPMVRLPETAHDVAFEFDGGDLEGWSPANQIAHLRAEDGLMLGDTSGADPYMYRNMLDVTTDRYRGMEIRMRTEGATGAQFYWTTAADTAVNEAKGVDFAIKGDGAFHTYRVDLAGHPAWDGQQLRSIRLDPGNGPAAPFAIDYVRGVPR